MLSAIRAFAKSWVAAVLIGLLIVSFAVFGVSDMFKAKVSSGVITAGSRTVTPADFKREYEGVKARLEQQAGQPLSLEVASANGIDRRVLEGMAGREAFAEYLRQIGVQPSPKLIVQEIRKIPAFFDQVSGRFDKKAYEQKLGENGFTPPKFDQVMRDGIAQQHVAAGMAAGLQVPRAYTALAAIYALEARDIGYFTVEPTSVPQPALPTDADLTAFMKQNPAQFTQAEMRVLTVARFSPVLVGASLPIDEAELKKRYDFRKDTMSTPETRTIVQIPAKSAQAATEIGQRLAKGEAPAAVAKAVGVEAITYDNKPASAIADKKVAAAAFGLQAGQMAPVQGDLGPAVIKVVAITPGHAVTLAEARPALAAELRKDAASEKVYALSQAYDDARKAGAALSDAAAKAGVPAVTMGPLNRDGRDPHGQPVQGLSQKLMDVAFALPAGGESEVEEAGNGEYFAVRVEKVTPPALVNLADIKPQLTKFWMMRETAKRMQARADELAARVRKGESLEAVAASAGQTVTRVANLDRQSAGQNQVLSQELLVKAFGAKPGEVFTAQTKAFSLAVGKLETVRAGEASTLARITEEMRPQMSAAIFREIAESAQFAARKKVKVTADVARARAAIGMEPLPAATDPAKAGGKPEKAK